MCSLFVFFAFRFSLSSFCPVQIQFSSAEVSSLASISTQLTTDRCSGGERSGSDGFLLLPEISH